MARIGSKRFKSGAIIQPLGIYLQNVKKNITISERQGLYVGRTTSSLGEGRDEVTSPAAPHALGIVLRNIWYVLLLYNRFRSLQKYWVQIFAGCGLLPGTSCFVPVSSACGLLKMYD